MGRGVREDARFHDLCIRYDSRPYSPGRRTARMSSVIQDRGNHAPLQEWWPVALCLMSSVIQDRGNHAPIPTVLNHVWEACSTRSRTVMARKRFPQSGTADGKGAVRRLGLWRRILRPHGPRLRTTRLWYVLQDRDGAQTVPTVRNRGRQECRTRSWTYSAKQLPLRSGITDGRHVVRHSGPWQLRIAPTVRNRGRQRRPQLVPAGGVRLAHMARRRLFLGACASVPTSSWTCAGPGSGSRHPRRPRHRRRCP
jgi:hypothetical protein